MFIYLQRMNINKSTNQTPQFPYPHSFGNQGHGQGQSQSQGQGQGQGQGQRQGHGNFHGQINDRGYSHNQGSYGHGSFHGPSYGSESSHGQGSYGQGTYGQGPYGQRPPLGQAQGQNQGPRHNMYHPHKFSQKPSMMNIEEQNGKRISLDDIVNFIEQNNKFINKQPPMNDHSIQLDDTSEQMIESLPQNKIKQLDQLPKILKTIFTEEYMRTGTITNVTTPAEPDISYVSSVLMAIVPDFANMKASVQIEYIEVFLRKIHKESKENFTNFGYNKLGWDCKEFSNNIKNFNFGKDLLRYVADYLVINIFILDYETDSLIYVGEKTFCKYKKNVFLIKIKENHFEPIHTKTYNFMDHTSPIIKKLISSCFLVEYLDCDFTNEKDEFAFVIGDENLDKYFEKKEEKEPNLKKKKIIKRSTLNFGFPNYILPSKDQKSMPIQNNHDVAEPLESHQINKKVTSSNQLNKSKESISSDPSTKNRSTKDKSIKDRMVNRSTTDDTTKDDFSDDLNGFERDSDTDFTGMYDDVEGIIDHTKQSHMKNYVSGHLSDDHLSDDHEYDISDEDDSDLSESCSETNNKSVPSNLSIQTNTLNHISKVTSKVDKKVDSKINSKVDSKISPKVETKNSSLKTSKKGQTQDTGNVMNNNNTIAPVVQIEKMTNAKTVAQLREIAKTMSLDTSYAKDGKKIVKPKQMLIDDINSLIEKNKH
jgi:hypothetical protein